MRVLSTQREIYSVLFLRVWQAYTTLFDTRVASFYLVSVCCNDFAHGQVQLQLQLARNSQRLLDTWDFGQANTVGSCGDWSVSIAFLDPFAI